VLSQLDPFPGEIIAKKTAGFPSSGVGSAVAAGTSVGGTSVGATASAVAVTTITSAVGVVVEHAASKIPSNSVPANTDFFTIISSGFFAGRF
jgi:hypothetical protein